MTRHILVCSTLLLFFVAIEPAQAQDAYTITVVPSVGPNANGSPSTNAYFNNAAQGLYTGTSVGTPGTPSYYAPSSSTFPTGTLATPTVTGNWLGVQYGPNSPYAQEVGNNIWFGIKITANTPGGQFTPAQVLNDYNNAGMVAVTVSGGLKSDAQQGNPPGTTAAAIAGIVNDPTGANGGIGGLLQYLNGGGVTASNLLATTLAGLDPNGTPVGPSTELTGLYYSGPGFSIAENPSETLAQQVAALLSGFPGGVPGSAIVFGGSSFSGLGSVVFGNNIAIPEPASVAILAVGIVGLLGYTYTRRRRAAPLAGAC